MTVNSPPEKNKTTSPSPSPFQRNKFSQSFSVSRGAPPRHRPIRSSPMSDFLYSSPTPTHAPASPYSSFFGGFSWNNDKTDSRSCDTKLLSPASTFTRTSRVYNGFMFLKVCNIYVGSDDSGFSSNLTSPGIIKSALASTLRTQKSNNGGSTVFGSLYKPDIIKMSSPRRRSLSRSPGYGEISTLRTERTSEWIERKHLE